MKQKSKPGKPVYERGVTSRLEAKHWDRDWLLGWRDICRSTDERTVISASIPRAAVGDKYLLAFTGSELLSSASESMHLRLRLRCQTEAGGYIT